MSSDGELSQSIHTISLGRGVQLVGKKKSKLFDLKSIHSAFVVVFPIGTSVPTRKWSGFYVRIVRGTSPPQLLDLAAVMKIPQAASMHGDEIARRLIARKRVFLRRLRDKIEAMYTSPNTKVKTNRRENELGKLRSQLSSDLETTVASKLQAFQSAIIDILNQNSLIQASKPDDQSTIVTPVIQTLHGAVLSQDSKLGNTVYVAATPNLKHCSSVCRVTYRGVSETANLIWRPSDGDVPYIANWNASSIEFKIAVVYALRSSLTVGFSGGSFKNKGGGGSKVLAVPMGVVYINGKWLSSTDLDVRWLFDALNQTSGTASPTYEAFVTTLMRSLMECAFEASIGGFDQICRSAGRDWAPVLGRLFL